MINGCGNLETDSTSRILCGKRHPGTPSSYNLMCDTEIYLETPITKNFYTKVRCCNYSPFILQGRNSWRFFRGFLSESRRGAPVPQPCQVSFMDLPVRKVIGAQRTSTCHPNSEDNHCTERQLKSFDIILWIWNSSLKWLVYLILHESYVMLFHCFFQNTNVYYFYYNIMPWFNLRSLSLSVYHVLYVTRYMNH